MGGPPFDQLMTLSVFEQPLQWFRRGQHAKTAQNARPGASFPLGGGFSLWALVTQRTGERKLISPSQLIKTRDCHLVCN